MSESPYSVADRTLQTYPHSEDCPSAILCDQRDICAYWRTLVVRQRTGQ